MKRTTPRIDGRPCRLGFAGVLAALLLAQIGVPAQKAPRDERPARICREIPGGGGLGPIRASDNANTILLAPGSGQLRSLSLNTLRNSWTTELGGELLFAAQEGPTGDITVATQEAESFTVRRLSADLGLVRASSALPRSTYSAVFPVDGAVLAFTNDGVSRLLDPSGRTVWVSGERLPAAGRVIAGQRYIAVTGADEHLVLRASDGSVAMRLKRSIFGRVFGFSGESAILACRPDEICVVDVRESRMRWRFRTGGAVNGVTVTGGTLIAASSDNFIYRLAAGDGDVIWKARTGDRVLAAPVVSGELVFAVNSLQGTVGIYDLADGRPRDLARIPSGETIVAVLPLRDGRFVVSTAGRIYEFGYECAEKRTADPEGFAVPGFKGTSLPVSATSSIPGSYRTSRP